MPYNASTVWEVRPGTGNANNGGGFGGTGTDYSNQNTAQYSFLAAGGTYTNNLTATNVNPAVLSSASYNFTASDVGNVINITAGTNFVAGRYQIISVAANAATLDRNCCTGGAASVGSGYVGGAITTPDAIYATIVAGNKVWINNGGATAATMLGARSFTAGTIGAPVVFEGYNASRGDLASETWATAHNPFGHLRCTNYPTLDCSTYSTTFGTCTTVKCLKVTSACTTNALVQGTAGLFWRVSLNCSGSGAAVVGCTVGVRGVCVDCDVVMTATTGSCCFNGSANAVFHSCRATGAAHHGVTVGTAVGAVINCLFYDLTGSKYGVYQSAVTLPMIVVGSTFDRCTAAVCVYSATHVTTVVTAIGNLVTNCTTGFYNLWATAIPIFAYANRLRDNTNNYTGWLNNASAGWGDTVTDSDDATEYPLIASGTATAGAATTITLQAGSSAVDDYYKGAQLTTTGGTGSGQVRYIYSYVGSTRVATVRTWGVNPSSDTTYQLRSLGATSASLAKAAGMPPYLDAGAWQRQEPTLPAVGDVKLGVQYGDAGTEFTGTYGAATFPVSIPCFQVVTEVNAY